MSNRQYMMMCRRSGDSHAERILFAWRVLAVLVLFSLFAVVAPAGAAQATETPFWRDVSLGAPLISWYNRTARSYDIARIESVSQLAQLDRIRTGRKLIVFKSAAEAEEAIPNISDRLDIIGYNLEHGPLNPADEQADPLTAIKGLRALADRYGLGLAIGPDREFALSHGVQLAPYVDIFILQVQRAQTEPESVYEFVLPLIPELRRANPQLQISVQIRTEGDVAALADLVDSLRPHLDGVSILTSPETVDVAEALVAELDAREAGLPGMAKTEVKQPVAEARPGILWLLLRVVSELAMALGMSVLLHLIWPAP